MLKRSISDNLEFIVASLTYIAAHVVDYLLTVSGITGTAFEEGNPIIQGYMIHFGMENGLLLSKSLICVSVILGMKAIGLAYRRKKTKLRAERILYGGAILTTLGGVLWLYCPYV